MPATSQISTNIPNDLFDVADPNMPFLAAKAALELDNLANEKISSLTHVKELAKLLTSSAGVPSGAGSGEARSLIDPISSNVITRAFLDSYQQSFKSMTELASATLALSTNLNEASSDVSSNRELLAQLRDFCLALSRYASNCRESVYGERASHPYRK